jgi:hypothetical protein
MHNVTADTVFERIFLPVVELQIPDNKEAETSEDRSTSGPRMSENTVSGVATEVIATAL